MYDGGLAYLEDQRTPPEEREVFLRRLGKPGDPLLSVWGGLLWDGRLLWLRRAFSCSFDDSGPESYTWEVVDIERGARVALVEVPQSIRLLAVSTDRALAVVRDSLNVEHVVVYRIIR
jgi:hypothetical protein